MIFLRSAVLAILAMIQSSPGMSGFRGLTVGRGKCGGKFGDGTRLTVRPMTTIK
jgi:hypothetical protein